jgi:2-phosphoglycerate kinase
MTTLVLPSGRQIRVRASARQVRERLRHPGYISVGKAKLRREQVALICVEEEAVEEAKRRVLSRGFRRRPKPEVSRAG